MYSDRHGHLRHDTTQPDDWGREMLHYLREHDEFFERWRHEHMSRLDEEYRAFRAERAARGGTAGEAPRTAASPEPQGVAMPLPAQEMDPAAATIRPDAGAAARRAALEDFHAERRRLEDTRR